MSSTVGGFKPIILTLLSFLVRIEAEYAVRNKLDYKEINHFPFFWFSTDNWSISVLVYFSFPAAAIKKLIIRKHLLRQHIRQYYIVHIPNNMELYLKRTAVDFTSEDLSQKGNLTA